MNFATNVHTTSIKFIKPTAVGLQELPGDDNSVEPGCVVEGSKALLVQSIDLMPPSRTLDTALKKDVQQIHSTIKSNLHM